MSSTEHYSSRRVTASRKQKARAAATITVIGGSLVIDGQPANAATFEVTNTNASGPGSLSQAIADANGAAGADTITFSGAGASGTITLEGSAQKIADDLTIVGPGQSALTLTSTAGSVLYVYNEADLNVSGLTIANASGGTGARGILVDDGGSLTVTDVDIEMSADEGIKVYHDAAENTDDVTLTGVTVSGSGSHGIDLAEVKDVVVADSRVDTSTGDGLNIYPVFGSVTVTDSEMIENSGDGMYVDQGEGTNTFLLIERLSTISNGTHGLAIYEADTAEINDLRSIGNSENGFYIDDTYEGVTINNAVISGNVEGGLYISNAEGEIVVDGFTDTATHDGATTIGNGDGSVDAWSFEVAYLDGNLTASNITITGELSVQDVSGDVTIENATVERNSVRAVGYPQVNLSDIDGNLTVSNMTISGAAEEGLVLGDVLGAANIDRLSISESGDEALALDTSVGPTTITNSTIADNDVSTAYVVKVNGSDITIAHSTISANSNTGGSSAIGLDGTSNLTLDHSIVAGNDGNFSHAGGASTTANFSLVQTGSGLAGTNIETTDPKLGPLQNNGGTTPTMLPAADSPAFNEGDPAITGAPTTDQRGGPRIAGPAIDIGAVEVDGGALGVLDATASEASGSVDVIVSRTGFGDGAASVDVSTSDGTAKAGVDYTAVSTTVSWASGDAADKIVTVPLLTDRVVEGDEQFIVNLTNASGATIGAGVNTATVTITDSFGPAIVSLAPQRFADTRPTGETFDNISEKTGKLPAGGEIEIDIAGRGGVPADAVGVVMNITAIQAEANGYVTAHACVTPRPLTSSLNYTPSVNLGNEVISGLSADGSVCLFTSSAANLAVDVVGYITADSPLINVTPGRVLDTRATGETVDDVAVGAGKTTAGGTTTLKIAGRANVPTGAAAVVVNVTAVGATGTGYVTVSPCVTPTPLASSLNYVAGVNRGNELVASLDADGNICLFTSSAIHLTVDVVGFLPGGTNYNPVDPGRFLDTRPGQTTIDAMSAGAGKLAAGEQVEVQVAGRGDVPSDATAVVMNVTAVQGEAVGFVTVHPCQTTLPLASSLNYIPGVNGGNEIVAQLDADGKLCLYTSAAAHLTADVVGYTK